VCLEVDITTRTGSGEKMATMGMGPTKALKKPLSAREELTSDSPYALFFSRSFGNSGRLPRKNP